MNLNEGKYDKLICYGAGEMGEVYADFLSFLGIEICFWVDGDKRRIGKTYFGKEVREPEILHGHKEKILITSIYQDEISEHLSQMGFSKRILTLEELMRAYHPENELVSSTSVHDKVTVILDAYDGGSDWAGTELWALRMSKSIDASSCLFVTHGMENEMSSDVPEIIGFAGQGVCRKMLAFMTESLPIVLVQGFAKHAMFAATYLKLHYPEMVKIVSVLHNDNDACVRRHLLFKNSIDRIFAVSSMVKERAGRFFKDNRIDTHIQAVDIPERHRREYMPDGIIRIGYAARLTRLQKRADLLIDVIQKLELSGFPYTLNIAGDGECAEDISSFVKKENLEGKVNLMGKVRPEDMQGFWKGQDIFLNLSEYEGCSLSMLEAMSFMCVPIVTDVSGVREVVVHDSNGYIFDIENVEGAISFIADAYDREKLRTMGCRAYETVKEKCDYEDYASWWNVYIRELVGEMSAETSY